MLAESNKKYIIIKYIKQQKEQQQQQQHQHQEQQPNKIICKKRISNYNSGIICMRQRYHQKKLFTHKNTLLTTTGTATATATTTQQQIIKLQSL